MADLSDVETVLVALLAQAVYPAGTAQPSAVGCAVAVHRGWPDAQTLAATLAAGNAILAVEPLAVEQNVTRARSTWQALAAVPPALAATVAGDAVTFSGAVSTPLTVAVIVSGVAAVYAVQAADTLSTVATALAALIPGAVSAGPVLTVPAPPVVRIGAPASQIRELKRQRRRFQVSIFTASPGARDALGALADAALAAVDWLALPDGSQGRLLYCFSTVNDGGQKERAWRRTLVYSVEYPTTQIIAAMPVLTAAVPLSVGIADVAPLS